LFKRIKENARIFPGLSSWLIKNAGLILDYDMYQNIGNDANVVLNKLINMCIDSSIPKEI
jgi:hypothetical protein